MEDSTPRPRVRDQGCGKLSHLQCVIPEVARAWSSSGQRWEGARGIAVGSSTSQPWTCVHLCSHSTAHCSATEPQLPARKAGNICPQGGSVVNTLSPSTPHLSSQQTPLSLHIHKIHSTTLPGNRSQIQFALSGHCIQPRVRGVWFGLRLPHHRAQICKAAESQGARLSTGHRSQRSEKSNSPPSLHEGRNLTSRCAQCCSLTPHETGDPASFTGFFYSPLFTVFFARMAFSSTDILECLVVLNFQNPGEKA